MMFDQAMNILTTFFGRRVGKSIAGVALCFGLGVSAAYLLPQYLVTVEILNAEVLKISESARRSDNWQELNLNTLRREITQKQLFDLEDKLDGKGSLSLKQKQRLKALEETLRKLDKRMEVIQEELKTDK